MTSTHVRLNVSNLGQSFFFLAEIAGKDSLHPLMRHAGGFVLEALEEAQELFETAAGEKRRKCLGRAAGHVFRYDLEPGEVHDSWLLDPLRRFPPAMIGVFLAVCPPRMARYLAMLLEEKGIASLENIPSPGDLSPLARRWALAVLPQAKDCSRNSSLPPAVERDPLGFLARRPFHPPTGIKEGPVLIMMADAEEKIGSALPAGVHEAQRSSVVSLARSLAALAAALSGHPPEAANLALGMPRAAGTAFLDASKSFSLLAPGDFAAELFEAFLEYLAGK
jgi:hypothetical protein